MYTIDQHDKVTEISSIPQPSAGAPLPFVMSNDYRLLLAYITNTENQIALVEFHQRAYYFGPPNDEALEGHPLADRGLQSYSAFQVLQSSWIRQLERMNSVHSFHDPKKYDRLNHYIFTFHDSTFECVAENFKITTHSGALKSLLPEMQRLIGL